MDRNIRDGLRQDKPSREPILIIEEKGDFFMAVDFKNSETKLNLMRSFAGESQARNRYTIAASQAKKQNLHVIEAVFTYTANQEREHAEIFYNYLKGLGGETIHIDGGYPVDISDNLSELLRFGRCAELMEKDMLFRASEKTRWICLNCGYIYEGEAAPQKCPVCVHDQGYFIRLDQSPYES